MEPVEVGEDGDASELEVVESPQDCTFGTCKL